MSPPISAKRKWRPSLRLIVTSVLACVLALPVAAAIVVILRHLRDEYLDSEIYG